MNAGILKNIKLSTAAPYPQGPEHTFDKLGRVGAPSRPLASSSDAVLGPKMLMEQLPLLDDLTMLEVRVGALAAEIAALELLVCGPQLVESRPLPAPGCQSEPHGSAQVLPFRRPRSPAA